MPGFQYEAIVAGQSGPLLEFIMQGGHCLGCTVDVSAA